MATVPTCPCSSRHVDENTTPAIAADRVGVARSPALRYPRVTLPLRHERALVERLLEFAHLAANEREAGVHLRSDRLQLGLPGQLDLLQLVSRGEGREVDLPYDLGQAGGLLVGEPLLLEEFEEPVGVDQNRAHGNMMPGDAE